MAIDFPNSPTVGQTFTTAQGQVWRWDGTKWLAGPNVLAGGGIVLEASMAANQTVTANTWTTAKYDTKVTDTQNGYSTSTGIFTPTQAGLYAVSAALAVTSNTSGAASGIAILKNGSRANAESQTNVHIDPAAVASIMRTISALIYCNGTSDNISVQGYTGSTNFFSTANSNGGVVNVVVTLLNIGAQGPQGIAGGSFALLQTQQLVNQASCVFSLPTGTYKRFKIIFDGLAGFTASCVTLLQGSSDGGTTWKTANYIHAAVVGSAGTPTLTAIGQTADPGLRLTANIDMSALTTPAAGEATIIEPLTAGPVQALWHSSINAGGATYFFCTGSGRGPDTTTWNACRLLMNAGNITVNASLYGITQ